MIPADVLLALVPDAKVVPITHDGLSMTRDVATFSDVVGRLSEPVIVTDCHVYNTHPPLPWSHRHEFVLATANVGGRSHHDSSMMPNHTTLADR